MTVEHPTLADFEDLVRQMMHAENLLRAAIGTDAVLRRRHKLVNGMHHVIDRVTAECRANDENEPGSAAAAAVVPAQRAGNAYEQKSPATRADGLADLGDFADIPQLSPFAREMRRAEQNQTEVRP